MNCKSKRFTRKKALCWVLVGMALCLLLIILRWLCAAPDVTTTEGRESYLNSFGWEVDVSTEEYRTVLIPEKFTGVMEDYAKMQADQGFELEKYSGKSCGQYSYIVTNYDGCDDKVYATVYIYGKNVIAADIHSASVNGFMQGIK